MKTKYRRYTIAKVYNNKYALALETIKDPKDYIDFVTSNNKNNLCYWERLFDTVQEARDFHDGLKNKQITELVSLVEAGEWEKINE